jgi:hypothetical protein
MMTTRERGISVYTMGTSPHHQSTIKRDKKQITWLHVDAWIDLFEFALV